MKRFRLITAAALLIGAAVCVYAQAQEPPQKDQPQVFYGRGRGGVPFAWNDMNGDGICDLTGQPVGQRPIGFGRGQGRWAAVGPPTGQPVGQTAGQVPAIFGRGRGGVPYAWNDVNRDGICDLTGQPVGQRPIGYGRGQGRWAAVGQPAGQRPVGFRGGRGGIRGRRWR